MKTITEAINPTVASRYLAMNKVNRPLKRARIEEYKREMSAGRWLLTHQGIGFYDTGELYDGQNRLTAIVESGATVKMRVTRGVQRSQGIGSNGSQVTPQDVTDVLGVRTVGEQLFIHGYENANLAAAAARSISHICSWTCAGRFPVGPASAVLSIYGKHIESILESCSGKVTRRGATLGTLAFMLPIAKTEILTFATQLATGEQLVKGMPVFALRKLLTENPSYRSSSGGTNLLVAQAVAHAAFLTLNGERAERLKVSRAGINFFIGKQRANVDKVRAILGAE